MPAVPALAFDVLAPGPGSGWGLLSAFFQSGPERVQQEAMCGVENRHGHSQPCHLHLLLGLGLSQCHLCIFVNWALLELGFGLG